MDKTLLIYCTENKSLTNINENHKFGAYLTIFLDFLELFCRKSFVQNICNSSNFIASRYFL